MTTTRFPAHFPASKAFALAVLSLALSACGGDDASELFASTTSGVVTGANEELPDGDTMRVWKGVPYAQSTEGERRFRAPQPPMPSDGILEATEFGDACPQTTAQSLFAIQNTNPDLGVSEDCLNLNIYAPAEGGSHPVMVWIHGGGLDTGAGPQQGANPNRLVQRGVVVVTINYRLGILGYLAHPALTETSFTDSAGSGNYGLMDQIRALEWIQANIASFGGNPDNVTIFGESAGGFSIKGLMAADQRTEGLFRRAIIQSGPSVGQRTLDQAESDGGSFMSGLCANTASEAAADCLRNLSVEEILSEQAGGFNAAIIQRPGVLEQTVPEALSSGQFTADQVLEGTNRDEWRLFVAAGLFGQTSLEDDSTPYRDELLDRYGFISADGSGATADVDDVIDRYPLSDFATEDIAVSAVGTDVIFACPARGNVAAEAEHVPTYAYEFADRDAPELFPTDPDLPLGAAHAIEIQYVLAPQSAVESNFTTDSADLAEAMVTHWSSFAKNGDPNPSGGTLPMWGRFSDQGYQSLEAPASNSGDFSANRGESFSSYHNCTFWANQTSS